MSLGLSRRDGSPFNVMFDIDHDEHAVREQAHREHTLLAIVLAVIDPVVGPTIEDANRILER